MQSHSQDILLEAALGTDQSAILWKQFSGTKEKGFVFLVFIIGFKGVLLCLFFFIGLLFYSSFSFLSFFFLFLSFSSFSHFSSLSLAMGVPFWLTNIETLRKYAEILAKNEYTQARNPFDATLLYLALKKKKVKFI